MQCPNCGVEAININGREICLDCGIEIASGVTPAANEETEPIISEDAGTVDAPFPSNDTVQSQPDFIPETLSSENIIQDQPDIPTQLPENQVASVAPEMTDDGISTEIQNHQDLAENIGEKTVDQLAPVTPEADTVTDIASDQTNAPSEDTADHLDFKMEPTIEEIAENNAAIKAPVPVQEQPSDLLDLKADTGTSVTDVAYDAGSDDSVEQIVADEPLDYAQDKQKSPIFIDAGGIDISDTPNITDSPKTEIPMAQEMPSQEIPGKENYVDQRTPMATEKISNNGGYSSRQSNQVDSINIGTLGSVPQSSSGMDIFPGNFKGSPNVSEDYGYNADIMPAKGVGRGTYRKIAITLIIIINIAVLVLAGFFIKNKYFSSTADTTQVEPSVTIE